MKGNVAITVAHPMLSLGLILETKRFGLLMKILLQQVGRFSCMMVYLWTVNTSSHSCLCWSCSARLRSARFMQAFAITTSLNSLEALTRTWV